MKYLKLIFIVVYCAAFIILSLQETSLEWWLYICITVPAVTILVVLVHEITHLFFFLIFGFRITEIKVGIVKLNFEGKRRRISIVDSNVFSGHCIVSKGQKLDRKMILSLVSGGVSGLGLGVISLFVVYGKDYQSRSGCFLWVLVFVGLYSFIITLLNPNSADNKAIKKILCKRV